MKFIGIEPWMFSDSGFWMAIIFTTLSWVLAIVVTTGFWFYE